MTLRIELFFTKSKNWSFLPIWLTPRIQAFWTFSYDSKNWTVSWIWLKELNLFFSKWLKELNLFLKMTQKFCSLDLTQNWFFWLWLSERYCFVYFDSNNWTVFKIRPKGLNFFDWLINKTQRIVFSLMSHRIEHFFEHERIEPSSFFMTQRIEPFFFFWRLNWTLFRSKELNILFEYDSQNWTLFWNVTQRIEPDFQKIDSKNWSLFTRRLKELNPLHKMTQRIEPFFLKVWPSTIEPFEKYDSKDWTLLFNMTQRIEPSFHKWLEDLNFLLQICLIESHFFWKKKKNESRHVIHVHVRLSLSSPLSLSTSICPSPSSSSSSLSCTSSSTLSSTTWSPCKTCAPPRTRGVTTPTTSTPPSHLCFCLAHASVCSLSAVFSAWHCVHPLLSVVATEIPWHAGGWQLCRKPCSRLILHVVTCSQWSQAAFEKCLFKRCWNLKVLQIREIFGYLCPAFQVSAPFGTPGLAPNVLRLGALNVPSTIVDNES